MSEALLRWLRNMVWVNVPVHAVWINEFKTKGHRTLDGSTVHLQTLSTDADVGAALIELLFRFVILFLMEAHLGGVNCQTCVFKSQVNEFSFVLILNNK